MARPRSKSTARDMLISMAVLLVPIILLVWFFTDDPDPQPETIDVAPHLQRAEEASPYPILRAEHLPEPWTALRAWWAEDGALWADKEPATGNSWMIGYLGPDEIYYGVEQRDRLTGQTITRLTREGERIDGTVEAAGWTWERYESPDGRTRSLVAREDEMVAVVYADTEFDALEAFATALGTE